MKKTVRILTIFMALLLLTGCSLFKSENEKAYDNLVDSFEAQDYQNVINIYKSSELKDDEETFPDAIKYYQYSNGMIELEKGCLANAHEILTSNCKGFSDADSVIYGIEDKLEKYEGTYMDTSSRISKYLFIKDGRVAYTFEDKELDTPKEYTMSLKEYTFTTGEETMALGFDSSADPDYIIYGDPSKGENMVIAKFETNEYDTFKGVYLRISDETPAVKE